ncbi:Gram-negative bacterial tonB protein [compost metagenome]
MKIVWIQTLALLGMVGALLAALHFARNPQAAPSLVLPTLSLPALTFPAASPSPPPTTYTREEDVVEPAPSASPLAETSAVPRWLRPPMPVADDFPEQALRAGVSGEAVITCLVSPLGEPTGCEIESETPYGMGFGLAARRIVERGRLTRPVLEDGQTLGPRFTVRVPFHLQ